MQCAVLPIKRRHCKSVMQGDGPKAKERFVLSVAFSPDKRLLAAGAMDGTVAVWDLASGGQLLHIGGLKGHHKPVRSLAFTPGELFDVKPGLNFMVKFAASTAAY